MSRIYAPILLLLVLAAVALIAQSQEQTTRPKQQSNVQVLMHDKLAHMQGVLEGLVTNDFEQIADEADLLRVIGRAASWQAVDTEEYKLHSQRYGRLTAKLIEAAREKNHDAALLEYTQLNFSCIDCHEYMRKLK